MTFIAIIRDVFCVPSSDEGSKNVIQLTTLRTMTLLRMEFEVDEPVSPSFSNCSDFSENDTFFFFKSFNGVNFCFGMLQIVLTYIPTGKK